MKMRENLNELQFEEIVNTYSPELKKLAWRYVMDPYLVEDIVQEVFIKCYIHQGQLEDICSIKGWLYTITKNQCMDHLRTSYHQRVIPTSEFFIANDQTPESEVMNQQTGEEVQQQMNGLPDKYQEILYLAYIKDLKMKEIQQYLDINISTVKTRLFRAKRLLKATMN
ncbi:RNA polymerase sigma factor [Robertmurraya massiliosenegalensis]|uniref:RNA polymerase sigma factor n=2 Tax=Robertmurraya TaxID=2837507 RepID=UPI003D2E3AE2